MLHKRLEDEREEYLDYFLKGKIIKKNTAARLTKLLLNTFGTVIAPSQKVKDILIDYGIRSDRENMKNNIKSMIPLFSYETFGTRIFEIYSKLTLS